MASRSQWRVAAIMTSLSWHHHHDVFYFAFTKTADPQNYQQKYTDFCHQFLVWFFKPLTCIRNDIVLHLVRVYFNPECNENWRKAAYHASSDSVQRVVSYVLWGVCVCVCVCPGGVLNREDANLLPISKPFVSWRALFQTIQCFLQCKLGCISTFWQPIDKPKDKFIMQIMHFAKTRPISKPIFK